MLNKLKEFKNKIVKLWKISKEYENDKSWIYNRIMYLEKKINICTTVHVDIHTHQPNQVIVIGKFNGRDYVRCFDIDGNLRELIEYLKDNYRSAKVGRMDMPYHGMPFSAVYDRNRFDDDKFDDKG